MARLFYTNILKFKDILVAAFSFGALLYHFNCLHNFFVCQVFCPMQNFKCFLKTIFSTGHISAPIIRLSSDWTCKSQ